MHERQAQRSERWLAFVRANKYKQWILHLYDSVRMKAVLESFSSSKEAGRIGDKHLCPLLLVVVLGAAVAAAVPGGALQTQKQSV